MWRNLELKFRTLDIRNQYKGKGKPIIFNGNKEADIMIILNDIKDEALISEDILNSVEGKKMIDILNATFIKLSDVYITSLYKLDKNFVNKDHKTMEDLLDILQIEIMLVNPKYIITVGEELFGLLVSDSQNLDINKKNVDIKNNVGKIYRYNGMALIPIFDLSYIIDKATREEKNKILKVLRSIN